MTAAQRAAADELAAVTEQAGLYEWQQDPQLAAELDAIEDEDERHHPMPSPCSPWCLIDRRPIDKPKQWKRCRHRSTYRGSK